jgi:hypothetical protein
MLILEKRRKSKMIQVSKLRHKEKKNKGNSEEVQRRKY